MGGSKWLLNTQIDVRICWKAYTVLYTIFLWNIIEQQQFVYGNLTSSKVLPGKKELKNIRIADIAVEMNKKEWIVV